MKKLLSALLILVTVFTLFGCKAAPEEEVALPLDTATDTQSEAENQTEDKETEQQQESKPQTEEKTEEEPKESEQQTEQTEQPMGEKAPPCKATIDENFREDRIIVTMTTEATRTRDNFTAEDFPGIDVEEVSVYTNAYEDIEDKVNFLIILKNGTKQKVLDSIKILEQNPIVYRAKPYYRSRVAAPSVDLDKYEKFLKNQ